MLKAKTITELDIMNIMDELDQSEKKFINAQEELLKEHAAVSALATDEELSLLNDDEYDLFWFVIITIYLALKKHHTIVPISIGEMEEIEERNWELLGENTIVPWRQRLDVFYEVTEQEDLLSFIEDSYESDEDLKLAPATREVLFITSKSVMDGFLAGIG